MNRRQLQTAIDKHNIKGEIRGSGASLEVEIAGTDLKRFCAKIANWGGFQTGYGAWVLRAKYSVEPTDCGGVYSRDNY